ncbi:TetR/AcrR family transcriptional regulator [Streptomyces huiliensis]|uniref:TetR/AcrR family transcriptional regulator n=1 Tax=Streptomyces huiliensis TaxID=2876027 RepID=UPI001CC07420|nr:TetR family transcriptional regulator [Streptomyces huiliensis]MBZ4324057.1 TetR/AcrR family transcriptional regulator [Streptomyces huiliensis]
MADSKHFDPDAVLDTVVEVFWRQGMVGTGIQGLVTATGLSRSSLYATFGTKDRLYAAALRRYIERHSAPAFARVAGAGTGLAAVEEFFAALVEYRCSGGYAGWGCLITNAHAGPECEDPVVRDLLDRHHRHLHEALRAALVTAGRLGQLHPAADPDAGAAVLAALAYGVNLRSRAGADAASLTAVVESVLAPLRAPRPPGAPETRDSPETRDRKSP